MSKTHRPLLMRQRYNPSVDLLLHLRTLATVADQRSFTRAAAELGVPQPVVSRRVAALERHLGGRLLVRDPRGVVPSDLGRAVLPHARDLQVRAEHLLEVARHAGSGVTLWLPDGVEARALVSVRAAAAETGLDLTLAVGAPEARQRALEGATSSVAVLPCAPDEADLVLPLGAGLDPAGAGGDPAPRRFHLDVLRAHRGTTVPARRLHLGVEDDRPWVRDVVRRHAARAGLGPGQVVGGSTAMTAVGDVLAHGDVWLCTRAEARQHGLAWAEVADLPAARGYRLAVGRSGAADTTPGQRDRLVAGLGPALGALVVDPGDGA